MKLAVCSHFWFGNFSGEKNDQADGHIQRLFECGRGGKQTKDQAEGNETQPEWQWQRKKRERERESECTIQLPVYFLFHVFAIRRYTKQIADELDDCTILCTVRNVDSEKSTRIAHANYVFFSHKNVKSAQILSSWYWVRNGTLWKVDFFY